VSVPGFDLQDALARLQTGDWSALDELTQRFGASPDARKARELTQEQERSLLKAFAGISDEVLEWMYEQTWGRMTFAIMQHPDPQQALLYGAFREGQNSLALTILKAVAKGRQVDQPPMEGDTNVPVRPPRSRARGGRPRS
jgi:hypothetical protein